MAVIKQRVCDVLRAQGKTVEATQKTRVTIPGAVTDTGKPARLDLDVSSQGETALKKMIKEAEEATKRAWAPVLALKPPRPAAKKAHAEGEDTQGPPEQESRPEEQPQQHQPQHPGFGQN